MTMVLTLALWRSMVRVAWEAHIRIEMPRKICKYLPPRRRLRIEVTTYIYTC